MSTPPVSPTHLATFRTCPRQYQAKYVTKELPYVETEATRYGIRWHAAIEARLKSKIPLPEEFAGMESLAQSVEEMPGQLYVEEKMAIVRDGRPTTWKGDTTWLRAVLDCVKVNFDERHAVLLDWKTGKYRPNFTDKEEEQLLVNSLLIMQVFKNIDTVYASAVFTAARTVWPESGPLVFHKADRDELYGRFLPTVARLEAAYESNVWNPRPNGLCKEYCGVTSCVHNGKNP